VAKKKKEKYINNKHLLVSVLYSLLGGVLLSLIFYQGFFASFQPSVSDKLFLEIPAHEQIKIISIDNESIQEIGRWPFDRSVHADLINILNGVNPRVIGFDIALLEPTDQDVGLAEAFAVLQNAVLPVELEVDFVKGKGFIAQKAFTPIEIFSDITLEGATNTPIDKDGVLRKIPATISNDQGQEYKTFFIKIVETFFGNDQFIHRIPTDENNNVIVNFAGPPNTFEYVPYADVLYDRVSPDQFSDSIVLIGATAPDLHDEQLVPTSGGTLMPGVEIHANAINTILTNRFLSNQSKTVTIAWIIILSLILGFIFTKLKAIKAILVLIISVILYLVWATLSFDAGTIVNIPYPVATLIITYLVVLLYKYVVFGKERRKLKKSFSQYASPEIVDDIMAAKELQLGGEKRDMTVLFSDIRGFTTISEKLSPTQLVVMLNDYLSRMTQVVFAQQGVVDKFIGDAVMAFWNAPVDQPDHAYLSVKASLNMIKALDEFNKGLKEGLPKFKIGIGLNSGEMIAGNMGSTERFDYTLIGDNVNLGARLEGLTKKYGVDIIISESTYNELKKLKKDSEFSIRFLDKVIVKGKEEPVKIYEVSVTKQNFDQYHQAVQALFDLKIDEAEKLFKKLDSDDGAVKFHLSRIKDIKSGKLDWKGVNKLESK